MRKLFKNTEHQTQFERDGYVKLSLLSPEEVAVLKDFYLNTHFDNKIEAGFHISLDNQNSELVDQVGKKIRAVMEPKTSDIFEDCKVFTASYVIKEPGLRNIVPPHQDWTFVDETEFTSVTVWTPLVDVTEENGALGVIPGSHLLFNHPRSSPSPQSKSPLADHIFTLFPYVEIVEMKAGETLIFNNRLLHASPPNLSEHARLAVGIGVTQKEAQLIHYYHVPQSDPAMLECYEVEEDFYLWFNNARLSSFFDAGTLPEGLKSRGRIARQVPDLSVEEMNALITSLPNVKVNRALMNKLAALFNYDPVSKTQKKVEQQPTEIEVRSDEAAAGHSVNAGDERTFFQKYTPGNIARELAWRMGGRK